MAKKYEDLTPEQQAAVDAYRAGRKATGALEKEIAVREEIRKEYPPAALDPDTLAFLTAMRAERERRGLSLTDVAERSGIDRATISKLETGKIPNPTIATLRKYSEAVGVELKLVAEAV